MYSLLDPSSPPAGGLSFSTVAPVSHRMTDRVTRPPAGGSPRRLVVVCVSPLAPRGSVVEAVVASMTAGNRTLVSFPAGVALRTRAAVWTLADRVGSHRLAIVSGAELARDPDAELGHLVSVDAAETAVHDAAPVGHATGSRRSRMGSLVALLSDDFPIADWSDRVSTGR